MFDGDSISTIRELIKLSYQYGPFLFAILLVYIARWTYKNYNKACTRGDPPASDREKNACLSAFIGSLGFFIIIVIISIVWWFNNPPQSYKFGGRIEDLRDYQKTVSHSFYLKPSYILPPDEDLPVTHNDHFLLVRDKPFEEGEKFDITIFNTGPNRISDEPFEKFEIAYSKKEYVVYKLDIDKEDGKSVLVPNVAHLKNDSFFITSAVAGEDDWKYENSVKARQNYDNEDVEQYVRQVQKVLKTDIPVKTSTTESIIDILQDERSSVADKQNMLLILTKLDGNKLHSILEKSTAKEPMILTVLDLARHTDPKISFYSRLIIKEKIDIVAFIVELIRQNKMDRVQSEKLFLRIDKGLSGKILLRLSNDYFWAKQLYEDIRNERKKPQLLIPTASSGGDRYYVKATWDPNDKQVLNSLTGLFNEALLNSRTMDQERQIMEGRSQRYVYWYSKEWAINIAENIRQNGAEATFVGF